MSVTDDEAAAMIDRALTAQMEFAEFVGAHYSPILADQIRGDDVRLFVRKEDWAAFDLWEHQQEWEADQRRREARM